MEQSAFILIALLILTRGIRGASRSAIPEVMVSSIAALVYVFCLWIPAHLQIAQLMLSKIQRAGLLNVPTSAEIDELSIRWAFELIVVFLAEVSIVRIWGGVKSKSAVDGASVYGGESRSQNAKARTAVLFLVIFGTIGSFIFPAGSIENRAEGGQGFEVILRSFLVVGLSMLAYYECFRRVRYFVILAFGVVFLVFGHVRSPLLVVMFGYVAGLVSRQAIGYMRIVQLVALAIVLSLLAALMSNIRGDLIRGRSVDIAAAFDATLDNPYSSVYESGIDTLDGYRLSTLIQSREEPRPFALLTIFTTFVPRFIWADKPIDLSVEMSAKYLGYKSGGQFLSPIGFLSIAFGGYIYGLVGFFFVCQLLTILSLLFSGSFIWTIVFCVTFRFMLGGGTFDLYYGLTLAIPVACSFVFAGLVARRAGSVASFPDERIEARRHRFQR